MGGLYHPKHSGRTAPRARPRRGFFGKASRGTAHYKRTFFLPPVPPRIVLVVLLVGVVLGGAWYIFAGSDIFAIRKVVVAGNEHLRETELQDAVHGVLMHKRFAFLPQNILFVDSIRIIRELEKGFPKIESVRVARHVRPFVLDIHITERQLFAFWCQGQSVPQALPGAPNYTIGQCFIVDKAGVVFDAAPPSQGALVLTLVEFRDALPALGDQIVDAAVLSELDQLRVDVKREANVNIVRIISVNKRELRGETAEGWVMLFDPSSDLTRQIQALRETLVQKLTPDKRKGLAYIDLRTPGRVFYK